MALPASLKQRSNRASCADDPNWIEKSKALYQRKEEWLRGCTEHLNEARTNLRAAEDPDTLSGVVRQIVVHNIKGIWRGFFGLGLR